MKAKLVNVGRAKFNGVVEFNSSDGLLGHVSNHLASSEIYLQAEHGSTKGIVIVGGFRHVGDIELLDCTFSVGPSGTLEVVAK